MGLFLAILVCILALVLPCMILASSRSVRTEQRGARRRKGASSQDGDRPATAVPLIEKWWFRLARVSIRPAAVSAFLVLLARNVQNGVAWNDASWALILPFGLVVSFALLLRAKWEWAPVIDGAPPRPPWQIIAAKATAKFLAVVVAGVAVCGLVAISLETWPALHTGLDDTGLNHFAAALKHDTQTLVGVFAVLFVLLYWRTNTATRPEYVRPDGTPIPPPGAGASSWLPTAAAREYRQDVSQGGSAFWKLAVVALIIAGVWFLAGNQIRALVNEMNVPVKSGAITSPPIVQQSLAEHQAGSRPPAMAYQAPPMPIANNSVTVSFEELMRARAGGYNLSPRATIILPGQWVSVYWPDPIYKDGSLWKYVYIVGGNVTVEDCVTKAKVLLRRPTTQELGGPNLSCQPMHVLADSQSYAYFYSLP
jgi:hypothetical protein